MCVFNDSCVFNEITCDKCPATDLCNSNGIITEEIKRLIENCIAYENKFIPSLEQRSKNDE